MDEQNQFIEVAREAVTQLKRLSKDFPQLTSSHVKVAVETWNEEMFRKGEVIWLEKEKKRLERRAMESRAEALIEAHLVDDALDMLNDEFSREMDYHALIDLAGRDKYIAALRREAIELKMNSISPEQTADLWNGSGRPPVGGGRWNATAVSVLMR
ncbi:MAG: hypothetical protein KZQ75_11565 [Candidatus Thiodiazotropha sp. (ex Myrtea spinifera)]|nr:hypothetical protein [Candidatus Thiodiazotropha sp. (ex Myrtea spinifera)]MCU7828085.1 hypothetical protein [Candidatus Thiodiazotropha sp. (ex Myrtea sp. 'scaly one' KF741663)]